MSPRLLLVCLLAVGLAACQPKPAANAGDNAANAKAAAEFLAKNKTEPGVKTTASGLEYKIIKSGPADGVPPKATDEVKVLYEGKLLDGTVFDSAYDRGAPEIFRVDEVVPGWTEALKLMRPGDEWMVYVPPKIGYGEDGRGGVPPNAVMIFHMELQGVFSHP
ncbi:FKBP-type peptidyl-prolyl cis-trans isomerase [soil metagenome]